jgi:segregation and condensation protein A
LSGPDRPFALELDGFDGPLDLLLSLIERQELDITTISLARVADDYLAHVRAEPTLDPERLSGFIAVAARLLLIKSSVLLPRPRHEAGGDEEAEDPTDLAERLREYEAFRRAAASLRVREESGLRSYARLAPLEPPAARPRLGAAEPGELLRALERVAAAALGDAPSETVLAEPFTISEKIELLRGRCRGGACVSFRGLLVGRSRGEIVATFLALLELLRLAEVEIRQDGRYGDIEITGRATER